MGTRDILHVDIDAFLASVEQVRDPSLRGRCVVVGGRLGERGLVLSSSYEARRHGVSSGLTISQAERLLREARVPIGGTSGAVFLRGDAQAATRLAERVWEICSRYTPLVEVTSIDDCYLDLSGTERLFGLASDVARRIQVEAEKEIGLGLSLGVGENRTVARVATVFAKPGGVVEVPRGGGAEFLAPLPVRRLPGVGRKTERLLYRFNVGTIGELAKVPRWLMERTFGKVQGGLLLDRARGRDDKPVVPKRLPRSISRATSLEPQTTDRRVLEGMLFYLTERAAATLRAGRFTAKTVEVMIHYGDGVGEARSRSFKTGTDSERRIYGCAREIFRALFTRRVRLKLVGVALTGLTREKGGQGRLRQGELFKEEAREKDARLSKGIDEIRAKFGFKAVTAGPSIELMGKFRQNENGFVLKTPSLTK